MKEEEIIKIARNLPVGDFFNQDKYDVGEEFRISKAIEMTKSQTIQQVRDVLNNLISQLEKGKYKGCDWYVESKYDLETGEETALHCGDVYEGKVYICSCCELKVDAYKELLSQLDDVSLNNSQTEEAVRVITSSDKEVAQPYSKSDRVTTQLDSHPEEDKVSIANCKDNLAHEKSSGSDNKLGCKRLYDFNNKCCGYDGLCPNCQNRQKVKDILKRSQDKGKILLLDTQQSILETSNTCICGHDESLHDTMYGCFANEDTCFCNEFKPRDRTLSEVKR